MKRSILLLVFAAFILAACDRIDYGIQQGPEAECSAGGGEWASLSTGCGDYCYTEPPLCTMAFADGCDCGPDKCWNGSICVPDYPGMY